MTDNETDSRESNKTTHTGDHIVFTGIIVIAVLLLTWFTGLFFGVELSPRINGIGAIGSILLSFALFAAYLSFIDVQRDQLDVAEDQSEINESLKELQESQIEYIRANHEPHLTVKHWTTKHTADKDDVMTVTLENQGNGLAKNMQIIPKVSRI